MEEIIHTTVFVSALDKPCTENCGDTSSRAAVHDGSTSKSILLLLLLVTRLLIWWQTVAIASSLGLGSTYKLEAPLTQLVVIWMMSAAVAVRAVTWSMQAWLSPALLEESINQGPVCVSVHSIEVLTCCWWLYASNRNTVCTIPKDGVWLPILWLHSQMRKNVIDYTTSRVLAEEQTAPPSLTCTVPAYGSV